MRDRLSMFVALLVCIFAFTAASFLLPQLTEMASEQYLLVGVNAVGGETPRAAFERRVPLSRIRAVETKKGVLTGEPMAFRYLGDIRLWEGKVGDDIGLTYETAKGDESIDATVKGRGGFGLRYTDEAEEGAPPMVVLGTALGALRGLLVDYLWIKVTLQKEKGLLYEVMSDSNLITALQPRFPEV